MTTLLEGYKNRYSATQEEEMSLEEYLDLCRRDRSAYASAAERMLAAIGEPEIVDTRNDPRLSRLFSNRIIRRYPAFLEFYGLEDAINQIVSFFRHAAQGPEERKQILYLLGPVGGGKSSLAERLKQLMEGQPIYALKGSPVNETPLGLFAPEQYGEPLEKEYGIPRRYFTGIMSPWAVKRLGEYAGDISKFRVVRLHPSVLRQVAIAKTEPCDENNQDISTLVGKVDIRKLDQYAQHVDAYSYSGAFFANQVCLSLSRCSGADQDAAPAFDGDPGGQFQARRFRAIPSRASLWRIQRSRWQSFRNNQRNEAFLDRIYIVTVP
jgi:serine protein kinase